MGFKAFLLNLQALSILQICIVDESLAFVVRASNPRKRR